MAQIWRRNCSRALRGFRFLAWRPGKPCHQSRLAESPFTPDLSTWNAPQACKTAQRDRMHAQQCGGFVNEQDFGGAHCRPPLTSRKFARLRLAFGVGFDAGSSGLNACLRSKLGSWSISNRQRLAPVEKCSASEARRKADCFFRIGGSSLKVAPVTMQCHMS